MITLISGPSSVGKSTFYQDLAFVQDQSAEDAPPILFPNEIRDGCMVPANCAVHYNIMRPLHFLDGTEGNSAAEMNSGWSYRLDPVWDMIGSLPGPKHAILLVASVSDLRARCQRRREIEPELRSQNGRYPNEIWSAVYERANLQMIYSLFLSELRYHKFEVVFLLSKDGGFFPVNEGEALAFLRRDKEPRFSPRQAA